MIFVIAILLIVAFIVYKINDFFTRPACSRASCNQAMNRQIRSRKPFGVGSGGADLKECTNCGTRAYRPPMQYKLGYLSVYKEAEKPEDLEVLYFKDRDGNAIGLPTKK